MKAALFLSAVIGFAVMNSEIAAGRLFAPYFGTNTSTWAMLIGTFLGSMAVGNLLGARLSRRSPERWLVALLIVSALLLFVFPRLAPLAMSGSLARFRQGEVSAILLSGAFAAAFLALPVMLLGASTPLVFHSLAQRLNKPLEPLIGSLSGRLSAAGTLGSLAGTFSSGLLFLPLLGSTRTLDMGAALLLLVAAWQSFRSRSARIPAAAALLFGLLSSFFWTPHQEVPIGRLVYAVESGSNAIFVVDRGNERQLRVNDSYGVQSFVRLDGGLPLRDVWLVYALAPLWTKATATPESALFLGLGGGTSAELYRRLYPSLALTGVEIDPAIVDAGRKYLGISLDEVEVVIDDARLFVSQAALQARRWPIIVIDAFAFPYVPFHLNTQEFFAELETLLSPGGVVLINVGRFGEHREVVEAVGRTLATVFAQVYVTEPAVESNSILVAMHHPVEQAAGWPLVEALCTQPALLRALSAELEPLALLRWPESTPLLRDDHAPVEYLTDRIMWRVL